MDYRLSEDLINMGVRQEHVILKPQPNLNSIVDRINELVKEYAGKTGLRKQPVRSALGFGDVVKRYKFFDFFDQFGKRERFK